jgi:hypothetical protein
LFSIGRDNLYGTLQILSLKAFPANELTHLFSLTFGVGVDVLLLNPPSSLAELILRPRPEKVARRHAEAVPDEICQAQYDHDPRRQIRPGNARDNCKGGDGTVNCSIDEVPDVAMFRCGGEATSDSFRSMLAAEPAEVAEVWLWHRFLSNEGWVAPKGADFMPE